MHSYTKFGSHCQHTVYFLVEAHTTSHIARNKLHWATTTDISSCFFTKYGRNIQINEWIFMMKFIFNIETVILFNITINTPKYEQFDWLDMSAYFPYFLRQDAKYWEKNSVVSRKWRFLFKFFKKVIYKLLLLYYLNFSER